MVKDMGEKNILFTSLITVYIACQKELCKY